METSFLCCGHRPPYLQGNQIIIIDWWWSFFFLLLFCRPRPPPPSSRIGRWLPVTVNTGKDEQERRRRPTVGRPPHSKTTYNDGDYRLLAATPTSRLATTSTRYIATTTASQVECFFLVVGLIVSLCRRRLSKKQMIDEK